jgi:hypothetical protein
MWPTLKVTKIYKKKSFVSGEARRNSVYILVTEPVEPFGSTLYLFRSRRGSFDSVGDGHNFHFTSFSSPHSILSYLFHFFAFPFSFFFY